MTVASESILHSRSGTHALMHPCTHALTHSRPAPPNLRQKRCHRHGRAARCSTPPHTFSNSGREFLDLFWGVRVAGGNVSVCGNSVVVYNIEQPLRLRDVPYFAARRTDEQSFRSQCYLNWKWRLHYRVDRWHERKRDEVLSGCDFNFADINGEDEDVGRGAGAGTGAGEQGLVRTAALVTSGSGRHVGVHHPA